MPLTAKQLAFLDEYFRCNMNGNEAYHNLYPTTTYEGARRSASRLLSNVDMRAEINRRLTEKHMGADEVLGRLADMARSDISTFADIDDPIDLKKDDYKGKTHVIKKFKKNISKGRDGTIFTNIELELYDAQSALINVGKQHGLFADRHIIETKLEKELDSILDVLEEELSSDDYDRILSRLSHSQSGSSETTTESNNEE